MQKMTEERFTELMERIPQMEEKLNKLLFAFEKIVENGNLCGIHQKPDDFPFIEFDENKYSEDISMKGVMDEKLAQARKLQEEANELKQRLGF